MGPRFCSHVGTAALGSPLGAAQCEPPAARSLGSVPISILLFFATFANPLRASRLRSLLREMRTPLKSALAFPESVSSDTLPAPMTKALRRSIASSSTAIATSIALLLLSPILAGAQSPPPPAAATAMMSASQSTQSDKQNFPPLLLQQLSAIKAAALSDDYGYRQLAHLTENIGPRPTGSPQARAAAEYVAEELRHLGLEVRLQPVTVQHWVRGAETAALVEYPAMVPGTTQKIVLTALGGSPATSADGLTADVVTVDTFEELQALGRDKVAGKIVLFNELFDKRKAAGGLAFAAYGEAVRYRGAGPKAAADLGAVAALVRTVGSADYRLPHTGFSFPSGIPAAAHSGNSGCGAGSSAWAYVWPWRWRAFRLWRSWRLWPFLSPRNFSSKLGSTAGKACRDA